MSNLAKEQLQLALAIMETNHPFSYTSEEDVSKWIKQVGVTAYEALRNDRLIRLDFVMPADLSPLRNPHNLTPEQVGAGYRLVTEFEAANNIHQDHVEIWFGDTEPIGWNRFPKLNMKANWGASMRVPVSCLCNREASKAPEVPKDDGMEDQNPSNLNKDKVGYGWRLASKYETRNNIHQEYAECYYSHERKWVKLTTPMSKNWRCSIRVPSHCLLYTCTMPAPKPAWKLPDPPAGKQWHKTDGWEEEDLPPGYRPLLLNEKREDGDEMLYYPKNKHTNKFIWGEVGYVKKNIFPADLTATKDSNKSRTTRPLPTTPHGIPLTAKDIPPGSVIRDPVNWEDGEYEMIISVYYDKVITEKHIKTYKTLMNDKWVIRYPGSDSWQLCSKQPS